MEACEVKAGRICMSKKSDEKTSAEEEAQEVQALNQSKQNIWLAGLGALAKAQADAQAEGSKTFEALVKQGLQMQAQTQELAKKQWTEAAQQLGQLTSQVGDQPWGKLGSIFEQRVARAMASLGVPSPGEISALQTRVQALEEAVEKLSNRAKSSGKSKNTMPISKKTTAKKKTAASKPK